MHKYQNKYRIPSARLPHWDDGSNGAYFITICTAQRTHFFGTVTNGVMELNALAQQYWQDIPQHFPYAQLANFVAMPNHTHGIWALDKSDVGGFAGQSRYHDPIIRDAQSFHNIQRYITHNPLLGEKDTCHG